MVNAQIIPTVTDDDIEWVCKLMKLKPLDSPRSDFLKNNSTLDVAACPGSGKTTLVVAKLAILANKWPHKTRGICVLSHTNVARKEIQERLGKFAVGERLLQYPHFIDTIHTFANRFLSFPYLRSNGIHTPIIDDGITNYHRRMALESDYWKLSNYLKHSNRSPSNLRIVDTDYGFEFKNGKPFPAALGTDMHTLAQKGIEIAAGNGYFCYDEIFVWAQALLEAVPSVAPSLAQRFPFVMVDEMQDTGVQQAKLLDAVFPRTIPNLVVQRIGDPNQAIYGDEVVTLPAPDSFPDSDNYLDIPNSFRFDSKIAGFASPLAVAKVGASGLTGVRSKNPKNVSHTIFVFTNPESVIDAYAEHVLNTFTDDELSGQIISAVGAVHVHTPKVDVGHNQFPKTLPHYWRGYTSELAKRNAAPRYLVQYIRIAQATTRDEQDLAKGVETLASGLWRLASCNGKKPELKQSARKHRSITQILRTTNPNGLQRYQRMLRYFLIEQTTVTPELWPGLTNSFLQLAAALGEGATSTVEDNFLDWETEQGMETPSEQPTGLNIYNAECDQRAVGIQFGSIHSVKGQTHLGTLVLGTFWKRHSYRRLLPWLVGEKTNCDSADGPDDRTRLRQTYVAMTRPSHLLCLAIPRSTFDNAFTRNKTLLTQRGWNIVEIV